MGLPRASLTGALDWEQRRAFQIAAAIFMLSFYNDLEGELFNWRQSAKFKHKKKQLQRLVEVTKCGSEQLYTDPVTVEKLL